MTLFAAESDLFSLSDTALWLLRFTAAVGGAFLGWFLGGPLSRILYRLARGKPIPGWAVPWCKLLAAGVVGLLVYLFIPLGGSSGFGFGPGKGGDPGPGKGSGGGGTGEQKTRSADPTPDPDAKKPPTVSAKTPPKTATREIVEIELLGGRRFPGGGRYYLLKRAGSPQTLEEVDAYLRAHKDAVEVHLVATDESVGLRHPAVTRLRELAGTYRIPLVEPPEVEDRQ